ncbi:hypothetical protein D3C75_674570 [compost metagenome]
MKKYVLTKTTKKWMGITLYQIKAVRDIPEQDIEEGELGGWIAAEKNLDQDGNAWVYGNARVYGDAQVYGNAQVYGDAWVSGDAQVSGNARVYGDAWVSGNAWVSGDAQVYGNAQVYGDAWVLSRKHIFWASSVGSEDGTLTAYTIKTGEVEVTRGCFRGTVEEFETAVRKRHDGSRYGEEYLVLIEYIKLRFREVTVTEIDEPEADEESVEA